MNNLSQLQKSVRAEFEKKFPALSSMPGGEKFMDFVYEAMTQTHEATYTACLPSKTPEDFKTYLLQPIGWQECRNWYMNAYQQFLKGE